MRVRRITQGFSPTLISFDHEEFMGVERDGFFFHSNTTREHHTNLTSLNNRGVRFRLLITSGYFNSPDESVMQRESRFLSLNDEEQFQLMETLIRRRGFIGQE